MSRRYGMIGRVIAEYLRRIGYAGPVRPDAETLFGLHRAQLATVPYENLDIQLGRVPSVEPDALYDKLVRRGRGGFCFEMNGTFSLLLDALGFGVRRLEAAVNLDRDGETNWGNHLALVVTCDNGDEYLADTGLGDGFLDPLPFTPGVYRQGARFFRLRQHSPDLWEMVHDASGSSDGFHFRTRARELADFAPRCRTLGGDPDSPFVRTLVIQQPRPEYSLTLRARTLIRQRPGGRHLRELIDLDDFATTLADFGVPRLPDDELTELWRKAGVQQQRWRAEQDSNRIESVAET